ncbi:hypothetical protein G5I_00217 [Acromyrmex echinatior]|uniref:Uncharacterized protein n=1 Tax=Acromyrmex echinatior TaxID=103372 RepID=F4W4A5_ACREC|nr:hypothetical protein G5I_00217 [Acromyrmex echinatior]
MRTASLWALLWVISLGGRFLHYRWREIAGINALRVSVDRQCELASRIILTSKEIERRNQVAALHTCRDVFLEMFTVLVNLLNERSSGFNVDNIKKVMQEALIEHDKADPINKASDNADSVFLQDQQDAPNKGIRIEANKPDLTKLKSCTELVNAGLKVADSDLKVTYIYRPKGNRKVTSCVLEISSVIRRYLMKNGPIYLHYAAFTDHIRILQ